MQNAYATGLAPAVEGMIANQEPQVMISRTVETAAIGFGQLVVRGAADGGCIKAAGTAALISLGVTVRDHSVVSGDVFAVKEDALIMNKGVIWVIAAVAVTQGQPAYYTPAGRFTNVVGTNTPVIGGRFDSSTAGTDQLVMLRLS